MRSAPIRSPIAQAARILSHFEAGSTCTTLQGESERSSRGDHANRAYSERKTPAFEGRGFIVLAGSVLLRWSNRVQASCGVFIKPRQRANVTRQHDTQMPI
jgi:hypothetical protein